MKPRADSRAQGQHPAISLCTSFLRAPGDSAAPPSRRRHGRSFSARPLPPPSRCECVFLELGSLLRPVASPSARPFATPHCESLFADLLLRHLRSLRNCNHLLV